AAERMPERDRAAVDVELLVGNAELALAVERLAREGLVHLDDVDVSDGQAVAREQLAHRGDGTDAHERRIDARGGERAEDAERLDAELVGLLTRHHQGGRSAVRERRGVARGDRATDGEGGLERAEALERGLRPRQLVAREGHHDPLAVLVADAVDLDDLVLEDALL